LHEVPGGRRERGSGGRDIGGGRGGAAVFVGDDGASEGGDSDAQEFGNERGATDGGREPEHVPERRGRCVVRASSFSHILHAHRHDVRAESGECHFVDREV